jgi:hypothetical protein
MILTVSTNGASFTEFGVIANVPWTLKYYHLRSILHTHTEIQHTRSIPQQSPGRRMTPRRALYLKIWATRVVVSMGVFDGAT